MANEEKLLAYLRYFFLGAAPTAIVVLVVMNWVGWRPKPQPIAFSHVAHAGTREIDCRYCHRGVDKGQHAGVPSVQDCWNCHQGLIKKTDDNQTPVCDRPEIHDKLLKEYLEKQKDINWFKNYDLPEHVHFSHRSHLNAGKKCEDCHGDVKTQPVIQLQQHTTMGWCIQCHRDNNAPVDCTTCHH